MKMFTKVRKWAEEVNAKVEESKYRDTKITVTLSTGKTFKIEHRESTSRKVIAVGRGLKWSGNPKGLFMCEDNGHYFQEPSQIVCIEKMSKHL